MNNQMEQLLPVVSWLIDKFTSKESSSVPYETARRLMEAVIYCVDAQSQYALVNAEDSWNARAAYDRGYEAVCRKVYEAKELYDLVIEHFIDYGCRNYRDTVINGMPAFFVNYDARFAPQDHLLTLDYPLLSGYPDERGVNMIMNYLQGISLEQRFLEYFASNAVSKLLEAVCPDYRTLYLDNICYLVLLTAVGCAAAGSNVRELHLTAGNYLEITEFFQRNDLDQTTWKVKKLIRLLITQSIGVQEAEYFERVGDDYAVRIWNGIREQGIETVMPT